MNQPYSEQDLRNARKRVKAKKGFYIHLAIFAIVCCFLFLINFLTSPNYWWFLFPTISWGMAIGFHYIATFGIPGMNVHDKAWEEKEIEKELDKLAPPDAPTLPEEELELKEFKKLRDEWKDSDFV